MQFVHETFILDSNNGLHPNLQLPSMVTTRNSLLMQMKSSRESDAWHRFVELYTPLVFRWVSDLGVDGADRNDVVQEVFVVLLGKVSGFQYDSKRSFRGWLRTITLNKTRDLFRRKQRKTEPTFLERIESATDDETEWLTERDYHQTLAKTAMQLMKHHFSETTWQACWEHVAEGRSASEVAKQLGISANAVYLARGRVLKRLRQELDGLW